MPFRPRARFAAGVAVPLVCGCLAEAAVVAVPGSPTGFAAPTAAPRVVPVAGESVLRGFRFSSSFSGTYDSNVTQGASVEGDSDRSDFITTLGGTVSYLSKSTDWTFGGSYRGTYNQYASESDFSGYSQGASAAVNYDGGRLSAALTTSVDYDEGSNRNYGSEFVQRTSVNTALSATYRLSRKTSLQGNLGQSYSTASGGDFADTESLDIGASALWKYSPLTEIGPGLRYTYRTGSSQTGRSSLGPTVTLNYKLSSKVALNSRLGVDFASYEDGGSADPAFSASVGLNYEASRLWGMSLTFFRDTQADPSLAGTFTEVTSLRAGYHRKVRRATLNLGAGYDTNRSQTPDGESGSDDRNYFTVDASLGMPVFDRKSFASIFFRYADQDGGSSANSFDSVQTGFSISREF